MLTIIGIMILVPLIRGARIRSIYMTIYDYIHSKRREYNNRREGIDIIHKEREISIKEIRLIYSIIVMYVIMGYILVYNENNTEYQERIEWCNYTLGVDGISISLIGLIAILEPILIYIIPNNKLNTVEGDKEIEEISRYITIVKILIIILFSSLDLIIFFITFELILVPMFLIITRYGSKYQYFLPRIEAAVRFFIYTMVGSILMLIAIGILYLKYGTTSNELINYQINLTEEDASQLLNYLWLFLFFSFLIKIPVFPFHTWLPLAHSDAPTIGSIILAALLLKLASFGIIRYSLSLFKPSIIASTSLTKSGPFESDLVNTNIVNTNIIDNNIIITNLIDTNLVNNEIVNNNIINYVEVVNTFISMIYNPSQILSLYNNLPIQRVECATSPVEMHSPLTTPIYSPIVSPLIPDSDLSSQDIPFYYKIIIDGAQFLLDVIISNISERGFELISNILGFNTYSQVELNTLEIEPSVGPIRVLRIIGEEYIPFIYILTIISIIYSALIPLRGLYDFKKIIAYSSIIHMNFSIFGFFSFSLIGSIGSSFLMFTHAFISSALFFLIGILYKRYHSRFLPYFQGLSSSMPLFTFFFLFFTFANVSLPFCASFLSEFFILLSSLSTNPFFSLLLLASLILSTSFSFWFLNRLLFGSPSPFLSSSLSHLSLITPLSKDPGVEIGIQIGNKDKEYTGIDSLGGYKDLSLTEFLALVPFFLFTLFFTFFPQLFISYFTLSLLV